MDIWLYSAGFKSTIINLLRLFKDKHFIWLGTLTTLANNLLKLTLPFTLALFMLSTVKSLKIFASESCFEMIQNYHIKIYFFHFCKLKKEIFYDLVKLPERFYC